MIFDFTQEHTKNSTIKKNRAIEYTTMIPSSAFFGPFRVAISVAKRTNRVRTIIISSKLIEKSTLAFSSSHLIPSFTSIKSGIYVREYLVYFMVKKISSYNRIANDS